jgi:hypothetical protein
MAASLELLASSCRAWKFSTWPDDSRSAYCSQLLPEGVTSAIETAAMLGRGAMAMLLSAHGYVLSTLPPSIIFDAQFETNMATHPSVGW